MQHRIQSVAFCLIALLAAMSMWFYVDRILVAYQVRDSVAQQRPRGNLSDLYPRWLGARELLLHRRNPYASDITIEIQKGYYGRVLDPARPNDPKDQQGFAYPVYVVFLLAPLVGFPFHPVQIFFHWLLVALTGWSVCLWLRALSWRLPPWIMGGWIALAIGSVPAVQGIKLQQLSLLVAALLAGSAACASRRWLFASGALLALATIKPQLAWPLAAWLLFWAVTDWRHRKMLFFGFSAAMVLLLAGAEILLPGWWRMFAAAIGEYHRYTRNESVLDQLLPWAFAGKILALAAVAACALLLWRLRSVRAEDARFGHALALVMAMTVVVVPMYAPYNQVLLLPAILVLVRDRFHFLGRSRAIRFVYLVGVVALAWQWIASLTLTAAYLLGRRESALSGWKLPFLATFTLPVLVFALVFLDARREKIAVRATS